MCLPWNHKWETVDEWQTNVYSMYESRELPIACEKFIQQRCTHCGKEIVRKYRV